MPLDIPSFKKSLKSTFTIINKSQAEALAVEIAANFTAGRTAGEKHQSTRPLMSAEEGLTTEEKEEIALLVAIYLGYLKGFNKKAEAQILAMVKTMDAEGKTMEEIKGYVQDVFEGKESIVIDNTGKERKELYLDKDLKLSEITKTISKPFFASVLTYAIMTGENATHKAYEAGRKNQIINNGYESWVFSGPADERARPWHVALIGSTFTFGSEQSNYAEQCLSEPHCRHRAMPWYGDSRDVPAERWQKLKDDAGLHWSTENECWELKN